VKRPTALIADDEPLLRLTLARMLASAWPELEVVAEARNGREAIEMFDAHKPDVCFLDVHMPGISGVEAARHIGRRAHLVFVTAYDEYAVEAFARGALDYLVKPVEAERIAETVSRLKERLAGAAPVANIEKLVEELAARLERKSEAAGTLRWIHAAVGQSVRLIAVEAIDFVRADEKYTVIAWRDHEGKPSEALIRIPLKELVAQLDDRFVQVHRSVIVNRHAISHVSRAENETAHVHLKGRGDVLPVSRSYLHLFKQM